MTPARRASAPAAESVVGAGDRSARYERLVSDHASAILRYLHGVVGSPTAAEDLAQETFLSAWQHLDRLRDPGSARSWLFAIAANAARRHLRRRGRFGWLPIEGLTGSAARAIEIEGLDARGVALERALSALGEADRQLVLLVGLEGFTIAEASDVINVSPAAAKKRWQRACARVRGMLDGAGEEIDSGGTRVAGRVRDFGPAGRDRAGSDRNVGNRDRPDAHRDLERAKDEEVGR